MLGNTFRKVEAYSQLLSKEIKNPFIRENQNIQIKRREMLRLRPYNKNDAETIMSWIKDEGTFYIWTAGVLGEYPISVEQFNLVSNFMAFTAIDDNEVVGFFTMR